MFVMETRNSPYMNTRISIFTAVALFSLTLPSAGETPDPKKLTELSGELTGMGWGLGVGGIYVFGDAPVRTAVEEGGVLRVETDSRARVGPIFELHFLRKDVADHATAALATHEKYRADLQKYNTELRNAPAGQTVPPPPILANSRWPHTSNGPMFTVELGDNLVRTIGVGWMWAWQRYTISEANGKVTSFTPLKPAFNLGFSVILDPKVKALANGLLLYQPVRPFVTRTKRAQDLRLFAQRISEDRIMAKPLPMIPKCQRFGQTQNLYSFYYFGTSRLVRCRSQSYTPL